MIVEGYNRKTKNWWDGCKVIRKFFGFYLLESCDELMCVRFWTRKIKEEGKYKWN